VDVRGIHRTAVFQDGQRNLRAASSAAVGIVEQRVRRGIEVKALGTRAERIVGTAAEYTCRIGPGR